MNKSLQTLLTERLKVKEVDEERGQVKYRNLLERCDMYEYSDGEVCELLRVFVRVNVPCSDRLFKEVKMMVCTFLTVVG